jgi:plasmid stabilization system protein ParE
VVYRLVGSAEGQIDRILIDSAGQFGFEAAARYHRLMLAAMEAISIAPDRGGSRAVRQLSGVRLIRCDSPVTWWSANTALCSHAIWSCIGLAATAL